MVRILISTLMLIVLGTIASAQDFYKIRPGDVLRVEVLEDPSLNQNALVLPDGTVAIPMVGSVRAGGLTLGALRSSIISGLAPNFATGPTVFVTIQSLVGAKAPTGRRTIDIFIGAVNNPGKAQVSSGTNLLQFLAESGGFATNAAKKRIQLRRVSKTGETLACVFNYSAVESGAASTNSIVLQHGDFIVVPERRLSARNKIPPC